jgi:uncharacterized lipoprotein YajG
MKKIIFALMACAVLAGCKKDEGAEFIGVWKNSGTLPETLTVSKVDGGYRAVSKIDKDTQGYMTVESVLESSPKEVAKVLVNNSKTKALQMTGDGTLVSYLRNKEATFTRVN